MADALTSPFVVAAIVVCVAAVAKLRSPNTAMSALATVGAPASATLVRCFAVTELALGAWCVAQPGTACAAALAFLYVSFAGLSLLLARRRSPCGCFGELEVPASAAQSVLSAALAALAVAASAWGVHGVPWLLGRPPASATVWGLGVAGAVYGTVLAYKQLPLAWAAWAGSSA